MLVLVCALMGEARKPQNWEWMWSGASERRTEQVDTRLPEEKPSRLDDGATSVYAPSLRRPALSQLQQEPSGPRDAFRELAWRRCLQQLSHTQRLTFDRLLRACRMGLPPTDVHRPAWEALYRRLETEWTTYLEQAKHEVELNSTEIPGGQRAEWNEILSELEQEWQSQYAPLLRPLAQSRSWTADENASGSALQAVIDRLDLRQIEDDTVWRGVEQHAWFRMFEKLQHADHDQLEHGSAGLTSFVQLFRQPNAYRGKLVTVTGRVKLAYRVPAPENTQDLDSYYIFWLRPAGGQRSPIVVYCLDLPSGFPPIVDRHESREGTSLDETVTFHGYFFKRWAYRAQDGINTAPLLLAKMPSWRPRAEGTASPRAPSGSFFVLAVLTVAILSLGLAYLAYAAHGRPPKLPMVKSFVGDPDLTSDTETVAGANRFLKQLGAQDEPRGP